MRTPLLTTKFYVPPPHPIERVVPRPHLIQRLEQGLRAGHRLILLSAPAGFGKTTLLSEWLAQRQRPVAWLSLDEGDNDPGRFLSYLIGALQTARPDVGGSVLSALQTPPLPPIELLLTMLINEIAEATERVLLVLDDYHLIQAAPVHGAIAFMLNHLPPSLCLVIAGRADPPLPLSRLRARDQITEFGPADLRFVPNETAVFLNQVMRLGLSPDDVAALEARTEGWIAGLQLAALSMRGRADVSAFIAAFTGSNRYVLDYLVEEVLGRQPKEVLDFLLRTAILDRMTGALCDALTGRIDSQVMLETLEQANLFIIPLDQDRIWYRYHRLFAEFLRGRLRQFPSLSLGPEAASVERMSNEMPDLHRRASEWFEGHDLLAEAIKHALQALDFERAAYLIERAAREVLMRGEAGTLLSWLEALPQDVTRSRPRLCLAFAWVLVMTSQIDAAEAYVQASLSGNGGDDTEIHGEAATIRTFIAVLGGDVPGTIDLARQALEHLPADDLFLRGLVALNLGLAYDTCEDAAAARQAYNEAREIGQAADNALLSLMAITQIADLHMLEGKLCQAADTYREGIRIATEPGNKMPVAGMVYVGMGQLMYEWNDLDAADHYLTTGVELGRQWEASDLLAAGSVFLAQVKAAQGDAEATQHLLQQADEAMQRPMVSPSTVKSAEAFRARLWLWQGNLEAAARWVAEPHTPSGDAPGNLRQIQDATRARVLLAQGKPALALDILDSLLQAAEATGQTGSVIETLALRALALDAQGQSSAAMKALHRALALAEPEGYVRTFVDQGEPMAQLLRQARARGLALEYVSKLLAAFRDTPKDESFGFTQARRRTTERSLGLDSLSSVEPLSPRELEVLQLLATGLSNKEIAQTLVIAVGTVKQHLKSIYGKLEVHNRTEAANRARELDLL